MAYTRVWSSATPTGATAASQIDDVIRQKLVDIEERMATLIGNNNWATGVDPVIDDSAIKDLLELTTLIATHALTIALLNRSSNQLALSLYNAGTSGTAKTIDWANGNQQTVTMTGNCTFTFSNPVTGAAYTLVCVQDATGGRTHTWPATVKWPGGTVPTLNTTASKTNVLLFLWDGSRYISGVYGTNYAA